MEYFPKKEEYDKIIKRLMRYPNIKVPGNISQSFSRQKKIRFLTKKEFMFIENGHIGIAEGCKILKKGSKKYYFKF